jgi:hypothetical protein
MLGYSPYSWAKPNNYAALIRNRDCKTDDFTAGKQKNKNLHALKRKKEKERK